VGHHADPPQGEQVVARTAQPGCAFNNLLVDVDIRGVKPVEEHHPFDPRCRDILNHPSQIREIGADFYRYGDFHPGGHLPDDPEVGILVVAAALAQVGREDEKVEFQGVSTGGFDFLCEETPILGSDAVDTGNHGNMKGCLR